MLTWMKVSRSGGHVQGIKIGLPLGPVIPSQSPVGVGLTPASTPNSGIKAGLTSRRRGVDVTDITIRLVATVAAMNFILDNLAVEGIENVANEGCAKHLYIQL